MEALADSVSRIIALGEDATEDAQAYPVVQEDPSLSDLEDIVEALDELSTQANTGRLTINVVGDPDSYQIQYDPTDRTVSSELTEGRDYEIEDLYPANSELVSALENLRFGTVTDINSVLYIIETICGFEDYFDIDYSYRLLKSNIEHAISQNTTLNIEPTVFFSLDKAYESLINKSPESFRDEYLSDNPRCVFGILDANMELYSSAVAVTSISLVDETLNRMNEFDVEWKQLAEKVATTALIENIDNYLPPSIFNFQSITGEETDKITSCFYRHRVLFSIVAISSNTRVKEEERWEIHIRGKQFVSGTVSFPNSTSVKIDGNDEIELTEEIVSSVEYLFSWVYQIGRAENRIDILRNVITLYARSLVDIIKEADVVSSSANSNLRYYRQESVDDFVDFRQEMIEGAVQVQRQFSNLRSELMTGISRDIFRTFGFIIVISAGLVVRVNEVLGENTIFLLSSIIIGGYTLVTHRRIKGIEKQYTAQTKSHSNLEAFYGRFFDEDELEEFGVQLTEENPTFLDRHILPNEGNDEMTRRIRRDLALYYGLLMGMVLLAIILFVFIFIDPSPYVDKLPV